ncbi:MAG: VOC family protein [Caldilineaceae bacterium SB0664_bin_22]|nr:VOC family protein [Caldilineaceae bacterium SB0664_bin_22]
MEHIVTWFEVPALDIDRAISFYETVFGYAMQRHDHADGQQAFFPFDESGVAGALICVPGMKPCADGVIVFLDAGRDLRGPLGRVEANGGQIVKPRTDIGEHGFIAWILDSEGNRVGMCSPF